MVGTKNTTLIVAPSFNQDDTTFENMILGYKTVNLQNTQIQNSVNRRYNGNSIIEHKMKCITLVSEVLRII